MATLRRRARHMDPCCGYRHRRLRVSPDTSSRRPDQRGGNEVGAAPVENRPKSLCGFNATGSPATVSWPNECNKDPRRRTKMWLMRSAWRFSAGFPGRRLSPLRKRRGPRALACQFAPRARFRLRVVVKRFERSARPPSSKWAVAPISFPLVTQRVSLTAG